MSPFAKGDNDSGSVLCLSWQIAVSIELANAVQVVARVSTAGGQCDPLYPLGPGTQSSASSSEDVVASAGSSQGKGVPGTGASSSSDATASSSSTSSPSHLTPFSVSFLPPIHLICTLPATYPLQGPPVCQLSCCWLDESQLACLCGGLDELVQQGSGQVILYSLADWLAREAWNALGLRESLEIEPQWDNLTASEGRLANGKSIL